MADRKAGAKAGVRGAAKPKAKRGRPKKLTDVETLQKRIGELGSFTEVSKEDLQREYARINRMVQDTGAKLEGSVVVEREVGTVNNRHMAVVENELLGPYKKLCDMLTMTAKALDQLKRSPSTKDDTDDFSEF